MRITKYRMRISRVFYSGDCVWYSSGVALKRARASEEGDPPAFGSDPQSISSPPAFHLLHLAIRNTEQNRNSAASMNLCPAFPARTRSLEGRCLWNWRRTWSLLGVFVQLPAAAATTLYCLQWLRCYDDDNDNMVDPFLIRLCEKIRNTEQNRNSICTREFSSSTVHLLHLALYVRESFPHPVMWENQKQWTKQKLCCFQESPSSYSCVHKITGG
jgi:hypothetical protein